MALTDNLVSYWSLEEASSTRNDAFATNHLSDHNTVSQVTGKVANAAGFASASSQYLSVASADFHTGDIDFTFAGWFYFTSLPGGGAYMDILAKQGNSGDREYLIEYDGGANRLIWYVRNPANSAWGTVTWSSAFSTGTWYFVVVWHDSVNNVLGIQVNNGTAVTAAWSSGVNASGTAPFMLGGLGNLGFWFLNGRIDEVGFWKRTLTPTEKTFLYNSGAGRSYGDINPQYAVTGTAKTATGAIVVGATVRLYRTSDNTVVASTTSGSDGTYSFTGLIDTGPFYVIAYLAGSPDIAGTTVNTVAAA